MTPKRSADTPLIYSWVEVTVPTFGPYYEVATALQALNSEFATR